MVLLVGGGILFHVVMDPQSFYLVAPPYPGFLDSTTGLFASSWREKSARVLLVRFWGPGLETVPSSLLFHYWPDLSSRTLSNCRGV